MAFKELDVHGAQLVAGVSSMCNRLFGVWSWEDDVMGITPEIALYVMRWK